MHTLRCALRYVSSDSNRLDSFTFAGNHRLHQRANYRFIVIIFRNIVKSKKIEGHTVDIAPFIVKEPRYRSAQVCTLCRGISQFTCTPMRLSTHGMNHTCLCLSCSRSWSSFTYPGKMEGWVGLGTATMSKQSVQNRYVTAITVVSCSSRHASLGNWNTRERRSHILSGHKPRR